MYLLLHVFQRGRYFEAKGDLKEAKKLYENAIAINPAHVKSLHHLVWRINSLIKKCLMNAL